MSSAKVASLPQMSTPAWREALSEKGNVEPISSSAASTQRWVWFFPARFGAVGGDVGDIQDQVEAASRVATLVPDAVDLYIARNGIVPVGRGADRERGASPAAPVWCPTGP